MKFLTQALTELLVGAFGMAAAVLAIVVLLHLIDKYPLFVFGAAAALSLAWWLVYRVTELRRISEIQRRTDAARAEQAGRNEE
jgi:membrane associated rhomboid family serine protease